MAAEKLTGEEVKRQFAHAKSSIKKALEDSGQTSTDYKVKKWAWDLTLKGLSEDCPHEVEDESNPVCMYCESPLERKEAE